MSKKKRKLTEEELQQLEVLKDNGFNVRQLAKHFGVNQPSILKSLKQWSGVHRNHPNLIQAPQSPVKIEGFTTDLKLPEDLDSNG